MGNLSFKTLDFFNSFIQNEMSQLSFVHSYSIMNTRSTSLYGNIQNVAIFDLA